MLVRRRSDASGLRVIKHQAQAALIFACELTHFELAGLGRGFPVDKPAGILRRGFTDAVELRAAPAHEGNKVSGNHRQDIEEIVRLEQRRIDNEIAFQGNFAALDQEGKRKACGNAESFLAIVAAARKCYFQLSTSRVLRGDIGEINGPRQDAGLERRRIPAA